MLNKVGNWVILLPPPVIRGQKTPLGIGLIELTEPPDTLNYNPSFKH